MLNYLEPLEPGKYYHVFNHAVAKDNLFRTEKNYHFFLKKYAFHILPIADTFAYCMLPNHFHFAIRIKSEIELEKIMRTNPRFNSMEVLDYEKYTSKQFSNLFSSYTQSFNKQQNRIGTLFQKPFKRLLINSDSYFKNIIHYIHFNPVHHRFTDDLRNWEHSSFESFFSEKASQIKREEVLEWFENKENFLAFHQNEIDEQMFIDLELI